MPTLKLSASERADRGAILRGLRAYNASQAGDPAWTPLTIVAREGRRIVGGLKGHTHWDWLFVALLWIDESQRGSGLGTRLLRLAEKEAKRRGCRRAWLDTFSFQAPAFYRKMGYREFARLPDYPRGHTRHFFTRKLTN
jgi:GNAT superfamily N-acetyltransferase